MGNKPVTIALKTEKTTYEAGSVIKGRVYIKVASNSNDRVTGIHLVLDGEERVFVSVAELLEANHPKGVGNAPNESADQGLPPPEQQQVTRRRKANSNNNMLQSFIKLISVDVPIAQFARPLLKGEYEYPFEWELPTTLPPSLFVPSPGKSAGVVQYNLSTWFSTGKPIAKDATPYLPHQSATQKIQILATPLSMQAIAPIHEQEEEFPIHSCYCFNKGNIRLGFHVDRGVVAPGSRVQVHITGRNLSGVPVTQLEILLVERIKWTAANRCLERTNTLAREVLSTFDLPYWQGRSNHGALLTSDASVEPLSIRLWVPSMARLSYNGKLIEITHTLVIRAVTLWYASTPTVECPIKVGLVRDDSSSTTGSMIAETPTVAATTGLASSDDPLMVPMADNVVILPDDWRGQAADMIFIPPDMVSVDNYMMPPPVVPTAPDESLLDVPASQDTFPYSQPQASPDDGVEPCEFSQLQAFLSNVREMEELPNLLPGNPTVLARIRRLTPRQYARLLCHSSDSYHATTGRKAAKKKADDIRRGRMLAIAMAERFECRHVLASLWACPEEYRLDILRELAPLASDWNSQRHVVWRELEPEEADYARTVLQWF